MNNSRRSRVVVWLDPTAPQEASLQALADLGAATEILGLFVEDLDLLDLSRLSVAREITFDGTAARTVDQGRIEQQFRVHSARMRALFEAAARKLAARHTFRVTRGVLRAELLKVSTECDTLVVAHSRRNFGPRLTMRAQLAELLSGGPPTLVFVQEQWRTGQRIIALFDGSAASEVALQTAAAIARTEHLGLSVWTPAEGGEELQARAAKILGDANHCVFRSMPFDDIDSLARNADAENARVVVVPGSDPDARHELVAGLLDRASCSIIVAR